MKTTWREQGSGRSSVAWARLPWARRLGAGLLALALWGAPCPASAQTKQEIKRAHILFNEGIALSAAQNWSGALGKFKEVAQVKMTAQVAFNIAECEEHMGQLLSALGNYRLADDESRNGKAKDVAMQVQGRITDLQERIPKLTVLRGAHAETAILVLDSAEIGATQIGTEILVDPGTHVIVGRIGKDEGARETVTLEEKEAKTVTVNIDPSLVQKAVPKPVTPPQGPGAAPAQTTGGSKVPGAVVAGLGVASLGVGVAFLVMRQGTISDLEALCGGDATCPPSAEATADRGRTFTGVAEVTVALGVVGIATGVVLLVRSRSKVAAAAASRALAPSEARLRVGFMGAAPGATLGGASLVGSF